MRTQTGCGHWFLWQENGGALVTFLPMVKHSGAVIQYNLYKLYWITAPLCYSIGRNVTRAPPFSYRKNQYLLAISMRAHLLILKTLLIRRDLLNLLIKHAVQHHKCIEVYRYISIYIANASIYFYDKCMPANNSSITNRYHFILNCVFPT